MKFIKALIGLILVFIYHIPHLIFLSLQFSYAQVFRNEENLTADPKVHLQRARKLLKRKKNSLLLYAALEIRFALERIINNELIFATKASKKMLKEYNPVKKRKNISRLDKDADYPHRIYCINRKTGERFQSEEYKPLDQNKVEEIQGKLGNLLHPQVGIPLGMSNHQWYIETRKFLDNSLEYLTKIQKDNSPYFLYKDLEQFELEKIEN